MPGRSTGDRTSDAGASARVRYQELWMRHRGERLITEIVLGAACGVGTAALYDWPTGVATAVAAAFLYAVGQRVRPGPVVRWRRGAAAERRTGAHLAMLAGTGCYVLHDRVLPTGSGATGTTGATGGTGAAEARARRWSGDPASNLDHLIIGHTGVYAVITRRWRQTDQVRAERGRLLVGGRAADRLSWLSAYTAETVAAILGDELGFDVPVSCVVAVHGGRLPREGLTAGDTHGEVMFQRADRLPAFIQTRPVVLTPAQVRGIADAAESRFPPMTD